MPPLLRSISTLLRLRGKIVSSQFLLAGLAGTARITPSACLLSAKRAGMSGKIMPKQQLSDISPLTLPCILLLKNNSSCVLTKITKDEAEIITPEAEEITQTVPLENLAENYSGYVFQIFHVDDSELPRWYFGETSGTDRHGWGVQIWDDYDCCFGLWEEGLRKGKNGQLFMSHDGSEIEMRVYNSPE